MLFVDYTLSLAITSADHEDTYNHEQKLDSTLWQQGLQHLNSKLPMTTPGPGRTFGKHRGTVKINLSPRPPWLGLGYVLQEGGKHLLGFIW